MPQVIYYVYITMSIISAREAEQIILDNYLVTSHMYVDFSSSNYVLPSMDDFYRVLEEDQTDKIPYYDGFKCGAYAQVVRAEFLKRRLKYCVGVAKIKFTDTGDIHFCLIWIDNNKKPHATEPQNDKEITRNFTIIKADFIAS